MGRKNQRRQDCLLEYTLHPPPPVCIILKKCFRAENSQTLRHSYTSLWTNNIFVATFKELILVICIHRLSAVKQRKLCRCLVDLPENLDHSHQNKTHKIYWPSEFFT